MNEHESHELHELLKEPGLSQMRGIETNTNCTNNTNNLNEHALELCSLATEGTQELHESHELFKERRLEDDAIFFQSLWVAEVEQDA